MKVGLPNPVALSPSVTLPVALMLFVTLMLMAVLFVDSGDGFIFHSIHALGCSLIPMLCCVIIVCACVTHIQL